MTRSYCFSPSTPSSFVLLFDTFFECERDRICFITMAGVLKAHIIFIRNLASCYCTVLGSRGGLPSPAPLLPKPPGLLWHSARSLTFSSFPQWLSEQCPASLCVRALCHSAALSPLILLPVHKGTIVGRLVLRHDFNGFCGGRCVSCASISSQPRPEEALRHHVWILWKMGFACCEIFSRQGTAIDLTFWPVQQNGTKTHLYAPMMSNPREKKCCQIRYWRKWHLKRCKMSLKLHATDY